MFFLLSSQIIGWSGKKKTAPRENEERKGGFSGGFRHQRWQSHPLGDNGVGFFYLSSQLWMAKMPSTAPLMVVSLEIQWQTHALGFSLGIIFLNLTAGIHVPSFSFSPWCQDSVFPLWFQINEQMFSPFAYLLPS
jgi:hypothetical protein